jgi:hypothetical protein
MVPVRISVPPNSLISLIFCVELITIFLNIVNYLAYRVNYEYI